jgi:hypothetical protein
MTYDGFVQLTMAAMNLRSYIPHDDIFITHMLKMMRFGMVKTWLTEAQHVCLKLE